MERFIWKQATALLQKQRRSKIWRRVVSSMAAVVVFVTTYMLILPAIALEQDPHCGIEEHVHTKECLGAVRVHVHTEGCYDDEHNRICLFDDYSEYEEDGWVATYYKKICGYHDKSGRVASDSDGELATVSNSKRRIFSSRSRLASSSNGRIASSSNGRMADGLDGWVGGRWILTCDLDEEHGVTCYEWEAPLIDEKNEFFERLINELEEDDLDEEDKDAEKFNHVHDEGCYAVYNIVVDCGMEVHKHTDACYELPPTEEPNDVVIEAWVEVEGEQEEETEETKEFNGFRRVRKAAPRQGEEAEIAVMALETPEESSSEIGDIGRYFPKPPQILIDGQPYKEGQAISLYKEFALELHWNLEEKDLTDTLTYEYRFPDPIKIQDVEETILTDGSGERKAVYSIKDNVLTVTYDTKSSLTKTSFTVNAEWDREYAGNEAKLQWNDKLSTLVKFDASKIELTKKLVMTVDEADGSLVGIYVINVTAKGGQLDSVTVTDKLSSINGNVIYDTEIFGKNFANAAGCGYGMLIDGNPTVDPSEAYNYLKKIEAEKGWKKFPGEFSQPNGENPGQVDFPAFTLKDGETCHIVYAVKLNNRVDLDVEQKAAVINNQAKAEGNWGNEKISASTEAKIDYKAGSSLLVKSKGEESDKNVPWTVTVNPERHYSMGGAIIADQINSESIGLIYNTDIPLTVSGTTGKTDLSITAEWKELDNDTMGWLLTTGYAGDALFKPENQKYLKKIEEAAKTSITTYNDLQNYVFVDKAKRQFVWFVPHVKNENEVEVPYTYKLNYMTDASNVPEGVELKNSASAGWRQWTVGLGTEPEMKEIELVKSNAGIRIDPDDGRYLVDWEIKISIPPYRNVIPNVYLLDILPSYKIADSLYAYDWLEGVNTQISYHEVWESDSKHLSDYSKNIIRPAFTITAESDPQGQLNEVISNSYVVMGIPEKDGFKAFVHYKQPELKDYAQFEMIDGASGYLSANGFGVWLGDLPATGEQGYTIAIRYTTQVNPAVLKQLKGKTTFTNHSSLLKLAEKDGQEDDQLAYAKAAYWIDPDQVKDSLAKRVASYDSEAGIVTYEIQINPNFEFTAEALTYVLEDMLSLGGAAYLEDSFQLKAEVRKQEEGEPKYVYEKGASLDLWNSKDGVLLEDLPEGLINLKVNNQGSNSKFSFSINNKNKNFTLEDQKLCPMTLTYRVQLPNGKETNIKNVVSLFGEDANGGKSLIDVVDAAFDFESAMHKSQTITPKADNSYKAGFAIEINRDKLLEKNPEAFTGEPWKVIVTDTMSKTLQLDKNTLKVYGINGTAETELSLEDKQYIPYYDERDEEQNILSVTLTSADQPYEKYRIVYQASVIGESGDYVTYSNEAEIEGSGIKSEQVKKHVYIQMEKGEVTQQKVEIQLRKSDPNDWTAKLEATFDLYAYNPEDGSWEPTNTGLKTKEGNLILTTENGLKVDTIRDENGVAINLKGRWHKLVETEASDGYLKGTTYFYLGIPDKTEAKPDDVDGNFKYVPFVSELSVYNYKISLRLRKVDAKKQDVALGGAEFGLYSDAACTDKLAESKPVGKTGTYEFTFRKVPKAGEEYYVKETKAPAGYNISNEVYTVTFNAEGSAVLKGKDGNEVDQKSGEYLIPNESGARLPESGGIGGRWYMIAGFLLMAMAGIGLLYRGSSIGRDGDE